MITSGLFDPTGAASPDLNGVESRLLRAMLRLEPRHVAILGDLLGLQDTTSERVKQWERSAERGYPPQLVTLLRSLQQPVEAVGEHLAARAVHRDGITTIPRPKDAARIAFRGDLASLLPSGLSDEGVQRLDDGGGDFWARLCDSALCRAADLLSSTSYRIHVELSDV